MSPPNPIPGTPQDWLTRARAKPALACAPLPPGGCREDLCYMAQQAAELSIKAVYMQHGWLFPYIHTPLEYRPAPRTPPWKEADAYWDDLMDGKYEWSSIGKQLRGKGVVPCSRP